MCESYPMKSLLRKILISMQSQLKKSQQDFYEEIDKFILKLIRKCKGPRTAKMTLRKNQIGKLTLILDSRLTIKVS